MAEFTIAQAQLNPLGGTRTLDLPANLEDIAGHLGRFAGVLTFWAWGINLLVSQTGGYGQDARNLLAKMTFRPHGRPSGFGATFRVNLLRRTDNTVDLLIRLSNVYTPGYTEDDEATLRGLYQDQVGVQITPVDLFWDIAHHAVAPNTNVGEVSYQVTTQWGVEVGFQTSLDLGKSSGIGGGASGRGSYQFQVMSGTSTKDFDIVKETTAATKAVRWRSRLKNVYEGNQPDSKGYSYNDPYNLVVTRNATTRWFKDVPNAAKGDLNLEYQGAWYTDGSKLTKPTQFEIVFTQRLMFGQVLGRWGAKGARVGGSAVMVPVFVIWKVMLEIDAAKGNVTATPSEVIAYGIQDVGKTAMEEAIKNYKQIFDP